MNYEEYGKRKLDIAARTYFTLDKIIDNYKVKDGGEKNKRAMRYMKDLFTVQLVIPVRKKISKNYVNNFFFFNILGISENFAKRRLSVNELVSYLLKYREKCNYAINLDNLINCYSEEDDEYDDYEPIEVKIFTGNIVISSEEIPKESEDIALLEDETLYIERVGLDKEYVLTKIVYYLIKTIRMYWKEVKKKKGKREEELKEINDKIMELYKDMYVCLVIYEIFIREFSEYNLSLEIEYQYFLERVFEWFERVCAENKEQYEIEELIKQRESLIEEWEQHHVYESLLMHERMYLAVTQCVAFIELLNIEGSYGLKRKRKIEVTKNMYKDMLFKSNGNSTLTKAVKEFADILEQAKIFDDSQLGMDHPTVKNILKFLDYIGDERQQPRVNELVKLAKEIAFPIYDRYGLIMYLDMDEREFEKLVNGESL